MSKIPQHIVRALVELIQCGWVPREQCTWKIYRKLDPMEEKKIQERLLTEPPYQSGKLKKIVLQFPEETYDVYCTTFNHGWLVELIIKRSTQEEKFRGF